MNIIIMGNSNSQSLPRQKTQQIITYQEYLQRRPRNNSLSQISQQSDKRDRTKIIHQIHYLKPSQKFKIDEYLKMLEEMRQESDCQNLFVPVMYKVQESESFCNDQRRLEMFFEHYEIKLNEQIRSRRMDKDFFSQQEVWYILYSLIKACKKFEKYKIQSGILNSSRILLNDQGHLKLLNILSSPQQFVSPASSIHHCYSPEQLRNIREKVKRRINLNVSQTFSIGIILLQACSLIDAQTFYDYKNMVLIDPMIAKIMNFVESKYSKLLISLLKTMTTNELNRPLPSQIYQTFKPYEKKILFLKPFKFNLPENSQNKLK